MAGLRLARGCGLLRAVVSTFNGDQGPVVAIDLSVDAWRDPAIASAAGSSTMLVVAGVRRPSGTSFDILGRRVSSSTGGTLGGPFDIDQTSLRCFRPDVGGAVPLSTGQAEFCVVWERERAGGDLDIHARLVDADGTFPGSTIFLANSGTDNDIEPAISKSVGDAALVGDFWNVAWIRDDNGDGRGEPWARRIDIAGQVSSTSEFQIMNTQLASNVDVTSTMSDELGNTGRRPFLVCFERDLNNGDVYVALCARETVYATSVISEMEDFDVSLAQASPRIATDGDNFVLTYHERSWSNPSNADTDVYMVSGGVGEATGDGYIALGRAPPGPRRSGRRLRGNRRCARPSTAEISRATPSAWRSGSTASGRPAARCEGRLVRAERFSQLLSDAVGLQYCEANAHGDSTEGGRTASWLSIYGSQSVLTQHALVCVDMKRDAFAFFICSRTTGNVNLPWRERRTALPRRVHRARRRGRDRLDRVGGGVQRDVQPSSAPAAHGHGERHARRDLGLPVLAPGRTGRRRDVELQQWLPRALPAVGRRDATTAPRIRSQGLCERVRGPHDSGRSSACAARGSAPVERGRFLPAGRQRRRRKGLQLTAFRLVDDLGLAADAEVDRPVAERRLDRHLGGRRDDPPRSQIQGVGAQCTRARGPRGPGWAGDGDDREPLTDLGDAVGDRDERELGLDATSNLLRERDGGLS